MIHEVPLERRTLHGYFSRELPPVLIVDPGDSVRFATLDAGWHAEPRGRVDFWDGERDRGHALVGPLEVRGARTGETLVVSVDEVRPAGWGITFAEDEGMFWKLDGRVGHGPAGRSVELAPFLGVLGMPPPEPGEHSTAPPRRWGGNIDCKELVAGTTLYLPIPVDGALFSAGDGHARQGDGEVSGTAIECPCERVQLTIDVRRDLPLEWPVARTREAWLAFGFDEDLDTAADLALATMLTLMERALDLPRREALALASVTVDLRVTQIVNGAKGVHAMLRHDAIR